MKLVIVESPNKCHTIQKILGDDYKVVASCGHVRDLSTSGKGGLGVNIEENFKPTYVNSKDKTKVIKELVKDSKEASEVILATDPDREGEAISWHLAELLKLPIDTTKRMEFHEVTENAILKALNHPRTIDMNLVQSQETRRIIDRIMGFKMSTLLKRKIGSLSAGRVQSVTLKLITEREKEINEFVPSEYWTIQGTFNQTYKASLESYEGQALGTIKSEQEADEILAKLPQEFNVDEVLIRTRRSESKPPFTTSTLQQEAFNKFKYSTKKTSSIAQKLYEGIDLGDQSVGLITYIRTDSVRLAPEFVSSAHDFIVDNYGEKYLGKETKKQSKGLVQDAHEAIRPTSLNLNPKAIRHYLTNEQYNLYNLIYKRALASLMAPKLDEVTTLRISGGEYVFKSEGARPLFDGFTKVYALDDVEKDLNVPTLQKNDKIIFDSIDKEKHITQGPSRYSEATLVKMMEKLGIGRPSTYSSTISTLYERKYISSEKGILAPTEQGIETAEKLNTYFTPFMDTTYTAKMEQSLDNIVAGNDSRLGLLNDFYHQFEPLYETALKEMKKTEPKLTGEMCPICGSPLAIKKSKYGEFVACSNYPTCNYVKPKETKPLEFHQDKTCPKCGRPLVKRKSKKGEFYACSGYPECAYILGNENTKVNEDVVSDRLCPKCGKPLLIKKGRYGHSDFYACSGFPKCRFTEAVEKKTK